MEIKQNIRITIGNFASILNVHQRTLRIWDSEGILISKRTVKNRRYYNVDDIKKAEIILFLTRNLLINLSGVKIILSLLKENKNDSIEYLKQIAQTAQIDRKTQDENLLKNSKRGRKKTIT